MKIGRWPRYTLCGSIAEKPTAFVDYSADAAEKFGLFQSSHIVRTKKDSIAFRAKVGLVPLACYAEVIRVDCDE